LLLGPKPLSERRLALAAMLNVLAVWSKLVEAPLILAQLGWLLTQREPGSVRRFGTYFLVILMGVSGLIFGVFGWRNVIFNAWIIPSSHPLMGGPGMVFSRSGIFSFIPRCGGWPAAVFAWLCGKQFRDAPIGANDRNLLVFPDLRRNLPAADGGDGQHQDRW